MSQQTNSTFPDLPLVAWFLIPVVAWLLAFAVQVNLPIFDYAPFVAIVFFPAGVRTLAVLVFGWRGAVGVAIGTLITYLWFFDQPYNLLSVTSGALQALVSGFSAYFMFRLVQWWNRIPSDLASLRLKHIITIVVSQGILSALLNQLIFRSFDLAALYESHSLHLWAQNTLVMAVGDTLGSMLLLYALAIVARWALQRAAYAKPGS